LGPPAELPPVDARRYYGLIIDSEDSPPTVVLDVTGRLIRRALPGSTTVSYVLEPSCKEARRTLSTASTGIEADAAIVVIVLEKKTQTSTREARRYEL